jgi:hypothetical protein
VEARARGLQQVAVTRRETRCRQRGEGEGAEWLCWRKATLKARTMAG